MRLEAADPVTVPSESDPSVQPGSQNATPAVDPRAVMGRAGCYAYAVRAIVAEPSTASWSYSTAA
jgi:hypothetical protein